MKNNKLQIIFCVILFPVYASGYARIDSLPSCINKMRSAYPRLKTEEYEYKGQRWFTIVNDTSVKVENYPDRLYYIKFYDTACKLVCTWKRGGIAGLNQTIPDTVDKSKINKVQKSLESADRSQKKKISMVNELPEPIVKIALLKGAAFIQEYSYHDTILYCISSSNLPANQLAQKGIATIDDVYYGAAGKIIATFKRATEASFYRAQQWVPAGFDNVSLKKKTFGKWRRKDNMYEKLK